MWAWGQKFKDEKKVKEKEECVSVRERESCDSECVRREREKQTVREG